MEMCPSDYCSCIFFATVDDGRLNDFGGADPIDVVSAADNRKKYSNIVECVLGQSVKRLSSELRARYLATAVFEEDRRVPLEVCATLTGNAITNVD